MGSHSAAKMQPEGPAPTAAPRASEWALQNPTKLNGLTRRQFWTAALALASGGALGSLDRVFGAGSPVKVRLGTLAPRGSSYTKHLLAMGERWRQAPGGGVLLTVYPDGVMGSEADMVRRMRLGQLQAGMLTATGLAEIEPAVTGLQYMPLMFHSLEEVDYIGEKLQPMLEKRLEEKGFMVLFWADTGWVRFFSKQPVIRPDDLRKSKLFVGAGNAAQVDSYRSIGFHPVPLETVDVLPSLQTGSDQCGPVAAEHCLGRPGGCRGAPHARSGLGTAGRCGGHDQEDLGHHPSGGAGRRAQGRRGDWRTPEGRRPARERGIGRGHAQARLDGPRGHPGRRGRVAARGGSRVSQDPRGDCPGRHLRRSGRRAENLPRRAGRGQEMNGEGRHSARPNWRIAAWMATTRRGGAGMGVSLRRPIPRPMLDGFGPEYWTGTQATPRP